MTSNPLPKRLVIAVLYALTQHQGLTPLFNTRRGWHLTGERIL